MRILPAERPKNDLVVGAEVLRGMLHYMSFLLHGRQNESMVGAELLRNFYVDNSRADHM